MYQVPVLVLPVGQHPHRLVHRILPVGGHGTPGPRGGQQHQRAASTGADHEHAAVVAVVEAGLVDAHLEHVRLEPALGEVGHGGLDRAASDVGADAGHDKGPVQLLEEVDHAAAQHGAADAVFLDGRVDGEVGGQALGPFADLGLVLGHHVEQHVEQHRVRGVLLAQVQHLARQAAGQAAQRDLGQVEEPGGPRALRLGVGPVGGLGRGDGRRGEEGRIQRAAGVQDVKVGQVEFLAQLALGFPGGPVDGLLLRVLAAHLHGVELGAEVLGARQEGEVLAGGQGLGEEAPGVDGLEDHHQVDARQEQALRAHNVGPHQQDADALLRGLEEDLRVVVRLRAQLGLAAGAKGRGDAAERADDEGQARGRRPVDAVEKGIQHHAAGQHLVEDRVLAVDVQEEVVQQAVYAVRVHVDEAGQRGRSRGRRRDGIGRGTIRGWRVVVGPGIVEDGPLQDVIHTLGQQAADVDGVVVVVGVLLKAADAGAVAVAV